MIHDTPKCCNYLHGWYIPYRWGLSPYLSTQKRRDAYTMLYWYMYGKKIIDPYKQD